MTASLSFRIEERQQCVRIPNAALRFFPDVELVREKDKKIVTGISDSESDEMTGQESAEEKTTAANKKNDRYVWVWEEPALRAVPVTIGIRDSKWTELVDGDLNVDDELVTAKK